MGAGSVEAQAFPWCTVDPEALDVGRELRALTGRLSAGARGARDESTAPVCGVGARGEGPHSSVSVPWAGSGALLGGHAPQRGR